MKLSLWLLSLAVVLGAMFGAYRYGRHVEGLARDAQLLDAVVNAVAHANDLAAIDQTAALKAAKKDADRRVAAGQQTGKAERGIADHPEYAACTLDAEDLANLINAVEGKCFNPRPHRGAGATAHFQCYELQHLKANFARTSEKLLFRSSHNSFCEAINPLCTIYYAKREPAGFVSLLGNSELAFNDLSVLQVLRVKRVASGIECSSNNQAVKSRKSIASRDVERALHGCWCNDLDLARCFEHCEQLAGFR